jgi:hypothetical protein
MNHVGFTAPGLKGGNQISLLFLSGFEDKKIRSSLVSRTKKIKSSLVSRTKRGSTSIKQLALIFNILTQATFDYFSSE